MKVVSRLALGLALLTVSASTACAEWPALRCSQNQDWSLPVWPRAINPFYVRSTTGYPSHWSAPQLAAPAQWHYQQVPSAPKLLDDIPHPHYWPASGYYPNWPDPIYRWSGRSSNRLYDPATGLWFNGPIVR